MRRLWSAVFWLTVCAVAAAGCGGDERRAAAPAQPKAGQSSSGGSQRSRIDPAVLPPGRVPRRGSEPAERRSAHVIRGWLRELRRGHIRRAASYFAIPSKFQNGTPVLTLDSRLEVLAVNISLPCGAVATRMVRSGEFTIVRFRLTERANGDCRGGAGNTTGGAIRVAKGKIQEWYRLYDRDESGPPPARVDPGNESA